MWNRIKVTKHATFNSAHAQRLQWLMDNPSTDAGRSTPSESEPDYKVRIKSRNGASFDFVVWQRSEKAGK